MISTGARVGRRISDEFVNGAPSSSEDSPSTCAGDSETSSPELTGEGWQGAPTRVGQGLVLQGVGRERSARIRLPPQRALLKTAGGCGGGGPGIRGRGEDELYAYSPLVSSLSSSPAP